MLATGGFSEVFLGLSQDTGELICVKQLLASFRESDIALMESEVNVLRDLNHPNIVQYFGTDRQHRFTILLEFVPGGSLADLLAQFGALNEQLIVLYLRQVRPPHPKQPLLLKAWHSARKRSIHKEPDSNRGATSHRGRVNAQGKFLGCFQSLPLWDP